MASDKKPLREPQAAPETIWNALVSEPLSGMGILSIHGQVLYISEQGARIFHGPDARAADYIGKFWRDLHPPAWYEQRLAVLRQVGATGKPLLMRTIWRGHQQLTWIYPIDAETAEDVPEEWGPSEIPQRFLTITRRVADNPEREPLTDERPEVVESEVVDLGPLERLTPRELEVLALIGQGLSVKEIARMLHRSVKTVDNHRQSIGKKLKLSDRIALAEIARRAGLKLEDAERPRV
jgi:DNA-binding CsgD family transcriptional regulator